MPEAETPFGEVMPHYIIFKCFLLQNTPLLLPKDILAFEKSINFPEYWQGHLI